MNIEQKIIRLEKLCFGTGGVTCLALLPDETELDALERHRSDNHGGHPRDCIVLLSVEDAFA